MRNKIKTIAEAEKLYDMLQEYYGEYINSMANNHGGFEPLARELNTSSSNFYMALSRNNLTGLRRVAHRIHENISNNKGGK